MSQEEAVEKDLGKCEECGGNIDGKRMGARFCGHACRNRNWCKKHPREKGDR